MLGTGEATGERRAVHAAEAAIANPLIDDISMRGARALLISVTGDDLTMFDLDEAASGFARRSTTKPASFSARPLSLPSTV